LTELIEIVSELGGDARKIRGWQTSEGWLSHEELVRWMRPLVSLKVVHPIYAHVQVGGSTRGSVELMPNVVLFEGGRRPPLRDKFGESWPLPFDHTSFNKAGLPGLLMEAIASAWDVDQDRVCARFDETERSGLQIGEFSGEAVTGPGTELVRSDLD
jgi:hypothetical protein